MGLYPRFHDRRFRNSLLFRIEVIVMREDMSYHRFLGAAILAFGAMAPAQDGRPGDPRTNAYESENRDKWQKPAKVVEALGIQPGWVIADIGTGSGYFVPYFSRAAGSHGRVFAVDIQQEMLALVERKVDELHLTNVTTVLSYEDETRLEADSVDLAILVDVFHELGSPKGLLSDLGKVLKPDGRLAIIDYYRDKEVPGIGPPIRYRVPERRLIAEVQDAGFKLTEQHRFLPYQYFLVFAPADSEEGEPY